MDDVSKVQQINNLARELMKHGQANSMEDAIKKAQDQVEGGAAPAAPMPEAPQPPAQEGGGQQEGQPEQQQPPAEGEAAPAEHVEVPENVEVKAEEGASAEDIMRKFEDVVGRQQSAVSSVTNAVNAHTKQFEEMNAKINGLIAEMTSLKQAVEKLANSPVTPPLKPKAAESGQTQFKQEGAPAPTPAPEQKPASGGGHARTGNFNPDDVSIEKFFYYGNR